MAGKFFDRLRHSPVAKILLGSAGGQGLLLLASPILTRLYSPADFGALAVLTALSAVLGVLATLRWEAGMVLPRRDAEARALGWLGLGSAFIISLLTYIVISLWPSIIAALTGGNGVETIIWLLPVTIMAISLHKILSAWMVRKEQFARLGQRNFLVGVGQLIVQVGLGFAGLKPVGLLLGLAGGRLAGTGGAFGGDGFFENGFPARRTLRRVAIRYRRFPLVSSLSAFVNSLGLQAPVLILSAFYGSTGFGLLALTIRVITAPVGLIADAVSQHFESIASKAIKQDVSRLAPILRKTLLRQVLLGAAPTVFLVSLGPWFFATIFGADWRMAGVYAQVLAIGYYCQFIVSPVSKTLLLLELHGQQAVWDISRAAATVVGVSACGYLGFDLFRACIAMTLIQAISYGWLIVVVVAAAKKRSNHI